MNACRGQHGKQDIKNSFWEKGKVPPPASQDENSQVQRDRKGYILEQIGSAKNLTMGPTKCISRKLLAAADLIPKMEIFSKHIPQLSPCNKEEGKLCSEEQNLEYRGIVDIDAKHKDPQWCSVYAADIYSNLHAMQLAWRPSVNYMEKVQRDITKGMRAILIDWLVKVSDEYEMVPDTLSLTVNLIDRYLSQNYIEKQKLPLLGVTCMLIASKFEKNCAPRVEEFCLITDSTYTKEEVVRMESCILNTLGFRLSVPTTKKFLRRFIQAAQVSYEVPSVELKFLANYLAELTLIDYSFLKYLPSVIAASAVFLARWTLDWSRHPWNPTLEHYTRHNTSDLESPVLELQDLKINTRRCMLNAIHEKYKQSKFKCVSTLSSSKPLEPLFQA